MVTMDGEHKHRQFIARMNLATYLRIRKQFKGVRKESIANYFLRLAKELEKSKGVLLFDK